jgi:hypothetical protein
MGFDVLEFHERAGRVEAEQGGYLPGPEAISCVFDGIDLESADPGCDPRTLLGDSRVLSIERTNGFADVCNLYISAYPVDGRLHIHSRIDASPGERWACSDGVWVDLDFLADRLGEHPGVRHAEVLEEDCLVTAYVNADLEPWELRDLLLSTDNGRNAVLSPHRFVVSRTDGTTVAGSGVDRPALAPEGAAGQALRDAVASANGLAEVTMAGPYLTVGGRLHLVPRVLSLLLDEGFEGIAVEDLRRPTSLGALAGRLRRAIGADGHRAEDEGVDGRAATRRTGDGTVRSAPAEETDERP